MRLNQGKFGLLAALLLASTLSSRASITTSSAKPPVAPSCVQPQSRMEEKSIFDSLRQDIATHPADFVTFETEASASRFFAEHPTEAYRETEPRVISRGILGYWGGKTLVVLPSLPIANPR